MERPRYLKPDINPVLRTKFYTPEVFDKKLEGDKLFADQVAGVTTLSYSWFKNGISPNGFSVIPYGIDRRRWKEYLNIDLRDSIVRNLNNDDERPLIPFPHIVKVNRDHGLFSSAVDVFEEITGKYPNEYEGFGSIITMLHPVFERYNVHSARSIDELLPNKNVYQSYVREIINQTFSTEYDFLIYLGACVEGKGIQIVYGEIAPFSAFLKSQPYERVDDNGVSIYKPVPQELITAIIPLGEFEKRMLAMT